MERERGRHRSPGVAPLAGAWIEMGLVRRDASVTWVAPLAGAWIEILYNHDDPVALQVAPLAGAWIEIVVNTEYCSPCNRRSPRGSVD